jgi:hypothetical protein
MFYLLVTDFVLRIETGAAGIIVSKFPTSDGAISIDTGIYFNDATRSEISPDKFFLS